MPIATRVLTVHPDHPEDEPLSQAADVLRSGGLVVVATETVYGLAADATNPEAVARIYEAKGRPPTNPLIVHAADTAMARDLVADWPEAADRLAAAFWPGPLTLVLPRGDRIAEAVTAGRDTVAIRVPRPAVIRQLIARVGRPLAAPSANRSTGISPTRAEHALADLAGKVELILDSGPTTIGLESTVLDLTTREPRILRPGPVSAAEIEHTLGGLRVRDATGDTAAPDRPASPGQMAVHYAPRTPTFRVDHPDQLAHRTFEEPIALIVVGWPPSEVPPLPDSVSVYHLPEPAFAARELYAILHRCDAARPSAILVVFPPDEPTWKTIRDRLVRATH